MTPANSWGEYVEKGILETILPDPRPDRRGATRRTRHQKRTRRPRRPQSRYLRRTRRRSCLCTLLPQHRHGLRLLFPLPRTHRPPRRPPTLRWKSNLLFPIGINTKMPASIEDAGTCFLCHSCCLRCTEMLSHAPNIDLCPATRRFRGCGTLYPPNACLHGGQKSPDDPPLHRSDPCTLPVCSSPSAMVCSKLLWSNLHSTTNLCV